MRLNQGEDDAELMDGKVCAIRITDREWKTPRGLQVGNSAYRAYLLYGWDHLNYTFSYRVLYGRVDSISFSTRYYGT